MLGINGKQWNDIQWTDVEEFLNEIEESFFFEFKKDEVSGAKLIKEIAALANTYGGYVFLGVSDDKKIEGCQKWDEQRIHATIHDSLSPIPSFDVKKFETNDNKKIYIIKVDEGPEPPYITNKGEIYERISSGSFVIKESLRLSQMYTKKEDSWKKLEKKITIDSVQEKVENVLGYIDVGFEPTFTNLEDVKNCFFEISDNDLKQIFADEIQDGNIMKFGDSLLFSYGNISGNKTLTPAHLNNFMEIMHDGSVRMRGLLWNKQPEDGEEINMAYVSTCFSKFQNIYTKIYEKVLRDEFIFAKKYEKLTTIKQFCPTYHLGNVEGDLRNIEEQIKKIIKQHQVDVGVDRVTTSDRIPKVGFYTVDKQFLERNNMEYNKENIAMMLFYCRYKWLGYVSGQNEVFDQMEK